MKTLSKLFILPFLFLGFAAKAQTETLASAPKKLQQLYLSIGTGPAVTTDKDSNPVGGTYAVNITSAIGPTSVFRLNLQHSGFTNAEASDPGVFGYLGANSYYSTFFEPNESNSISLLFGKRKQISKLLQFQALGGLGFNLVSKLGYGGNSDGLLLEYAMGPCTPETYYVPGVLLQAEALFLPTRFAGLTLGTYANITPKLPSAGLNLSLNLGLLK